MVKEDYKKDVEKLIEEETKTQLIIYVNEERYPDPEERKQIYKTLRKQFPKAKIMNASINWAYRVSWVVNGKETILSDIEKRT